MGSLISKRSESRRKAFREIDQKSDRIMTVIIWAYFAFGIALAWFYDTYFIALTVGGLSVLAYFSSKLLLPGYRLYQYVLSGMFAIFSAQFIYQMHGLFEMHFFFFVGSALLITYRNWKLILPLLVITVVHHAVFAWWQYQGMREIYFTQLDYMDLQAFIFHALLAAVIMGICGFWAYDLGKTTLREAEKSLQLESQLENMNNNMAFANEISRGNLNVAYEQLDENDHLGKSLLTMRDSLQVSQSREQRERFITQGIASVSDIIRQHGQSMTDLTDAFVRAVVKHLKLNQAGLFLLEDHDGEQTLRLTACYAYERKKFLNKMIATDEGLVGQCFQEREPIYMTTIPQDYIKITSGLGEATPSSIFLVPIKLQEEIVGVMEMASFTALKDYEKDFLVKATENIASAVISSRTTEHIQTLLAEAQQQSEILKSQEEEMRQNMEELAATQEEMDRKGMESENRLKAIEESGIAAIEFNLDGTIVWANGPFLELMEYNINEIQGKHHSIFVKPEEVGSDDYLAFWNDLAMGVPRPGEYERVTKSKKPVHIKGSYSITRDVKGRPQRVLKIAFDITQMKLQQIEIREKELALDVAHQAVISARQSNKTLLTDSMTKLRQRSMD